MWSYLLVGLVGAVIGGLLVAGLVPQLIVNRMAGLQLSVPSLGSILEGSDSLSLLKPVNNQVSQDPWQILSLIHI